MTNDSDPSYTIRHAPFAVQDDPVTVLAAVQKHGLNLQHASARLRNNEDIVLAAVQQNNLALAYASDTIRSNARIVTAAIVRGGAFTLEYAAPALLSDPTVIGTAVRHQGAWALLYAEEDLRNDRSFVRASVEENALAIFYAPTHMHGDVEIMTVAIERIETTGKYLRQVCTLWTQAGCAPLKELFRKIGMCIAGDGYFEKERIQQHETPLGFALQWFADNEHKENCINMFMATAPSELSATCLGYLQCNEHKHVAQELFKCSRLLVALAKCHKQTWSEFLQYQCSDAKTMASIEDCSL